MLEVNEFYSFGELKAGDKFAWEGVEHEKLSGNAAIRLFDCAFVEMLDDARVYLYEVY